MQRALERVRRAAKQDKELRFTTLLHHIYYVDRLREAYLHLKREAAPGVDGETWQHYGEEVEANLQDLSGRLRRGACRAEPVRRVYIPKASGGLLASVYLHYAFDLWAHRWRGRHCQGDVRIVRYADDTVIGFEHRHEGEQFLAALRQRLAKFGLEL
jgi:retron-type reverse transcriptase